MNTNIAAIIKRLREAGFMNANPDGDHEELIEAYDRYGFDVRRVIVFLEEEHFWNITDRSEWVKEFASAWINEPIGEAKQRAIRLIEEGKYKEAVKVLNGIGLLALP